MWYILDEKLDGIDPRGKLKGLKEGEGLTAYQKVYKWYSAVTGVTLKAKANLAMNPDKPKKVSDVSTQLEQWTALVESLETYEPSYSLGLPFRVTALQGTVTHANPATRAFDGVPMGPRTVRGVCQKERNKINASTPDV